MTNNATKFETGTRYQTRFACNADSVIYLTVARRTAKTIVTAKGKRYRITEHCGVETVRTGNYSMAPIFSADRRAA